MKEFSEDQLKTLRDLPFKTEYLTRILSERCDLQDDFHRYLLSSEYDRAVCFNGIMVEHNGDPSGVEFRADDRESWAFVLPDASEQGSHRIQYFDEHGFWSHSRHATVFDATSAMVTERFRLKDAGALDRMCELPSWRRGTEVAGLIQALNYKKITMQEFVSLRAALQ
jgi:hypothetical protein